MSLESRKSTVLSSTLAKAGVKPAWICSTYPVENKVVVDFVYTDIPLDLYGPDEDYEDTQTRLETYTYLLIGEELSEMLK